MISFVLTVSFGFVYLLENEDLFLVITVNVEGNATKFIFFMSAELLMNSRFDCPPTFWLRWKCKVKERKHRDRGQGLGALPSSLECIHPIERGEEGEERLTAS